MSVISKLKKNTTIEDADVLSESKIFNEKDMIKTTIPMLNVALSGSLDGGLCPGITMVAGESKHFKTGFSLILLQSYLSAYSEAGAIYYDSEFGAPPSYFKASGVDMDRVLHTPVTDVEVLKHDIMQQLDQIKRGDKVIMIIDSLGSLASKKEAADALEGKQVRDMSRPFAINSLFRIITPHFRLKDIPLIVINHTYKDTGLFPKDIVSGGQKAYLNSQDIWILGRQQDKEKGALVGFNFIINIEKSRLVREKSKISINVNFDGGINPWSGLLDVALESGHVIKPSDGWYQKKGTENKLREDDTNSKEFWDDILNDKEFKTFVERKYRIVQE
jgi:RecA/RadA recombinase